MLLYGMFGAMDVDGHRVSGMMLPMGSLIDQDIADILNFVIALEKPKKAVTPFKAAEVKAVCSAGPLTASVVGKVRNDLAAKGGIP